MSRTIEWLKFPGRVPRTWNPVQGCSHAGGPGCHNCFAEMMARRAGGPGRWAHGLIKHAPRHDRKTGLPMVDGKGKPVLGPGRWSGVMRPAAARILADPLRWRKPSAAFPSMSDPFHPNLVGIEAGRRWIAACFGVMAATPQHLYLILTKRPAQMLEWFAWAAASSRACEPQAGGLHPGEFCWQAASRVIPKIKFDETARRWPLPNVMLGVSAERQQEADARIPHLLEAKRRGFAHLVFVSYEPALGPVDFSRWLKCPACDGHGLCGRGGLGWLIAGGETGAGARPAHPDWFRRARDQCAAAGVPYFHKQNGMYRRVGDDDDTWTHIVAPDGQTLKRGDEWPASRLHIAHDQASVYVRRFASKKDAGHLLDGKIHRQFPSLGELPP